MTAEFIVLRKRDTDPFEVTPFDDEAKAREFYDLAQAQWSECWLLRVEDGPFLCGLHAGQSRVAARSGT